jgi:hypothetical protein
MSSNLNFSKWLQLTEAGKINYGGGIPSPHYRGQAYRYRPPTYDVGGWGSREGEPLFKPGGMGELGLGSFVGDAKEKVGSYFYGRQGRPPHLRQNLYIPKNSNGEGEDREILDVEVTPEDLERNHGDGELAAIAAAHRRLGSKANKYDLNNSKVLWYGDLQPNRSYSAKIELSRNKKDKYKYNNSEDWEDEEPEEEERPHVNVNKPPRG